MRNKIPGEVLIFLAALSWSLLGVLVKSAPVSVTWLILVRSLAASAALMIFAVRAKLKPSKTLFLTAFFYTGLCMLFTHLARISTVAMAISMQYAAPVYLLFFLMIKERKFGIQRVLPFSLLLAGVLLCVLGSDKGISPVTSLLGILVGLAFLFYGIFLKRVDSTSPFGTIAYLNLIAVFFCLPLLPFDFEPAPSSPEIVLLLVLSGIFLSGLSYVLFSAGLASVPLQRGLLITLTEMVLSPLWVFLALGEIPSPAVILGLLLVVAGSACETLLPGFLKKARARKE